MSFAGRLAEKVNATPHERSAKIWHIDPESVTWADGATHTVGDNAKDEVDNPGFLDYRAPVRSDLPMIDTAIIAIPKTKHIRVPAAAAKRRACHHSRRS